MKKVLLFLIITVLMPFYSFAQDKPKVFKPIVFSAGISSGYPFYGSEKLRQTTDYLSKQGGRFIIGTTAELKFNILSQLTFFTDADLLCDFNSANKEYLNTLDLAFSSGLKFFPGLGGFAIGLGYTLGVRCDFLQLNPVVCEIIQPDTPNSSWGNGVKVLLEYDFSHQYDLHFMPTIGLYWRIMPRGNNRYDNILSGYILINL